VVLFAFVEPVVAGRGEGSNDEALPVPVALFTTGVDVKFLLLLGVIMGLVVLRGAEDNRDEGVMVAEKAGVDPFLILVGNMDIGDPGELYDSKDEAVIVSVR
jgi:hypothetical protein